MSGTDDHAGTTPGDDRGASADVSILLRRSAAGAVEGAELYGRVYAELHDLAAAQMRGERVEHSLQPTALVHEAWLRLAQGGGWRGRAHFFGAAAEAMRRILVDHARSRGAAKRGGGLERLPLDGLELARSEDHGSVLAIDDVLSRLEAFDERLAQVVRLRFWAGLSEAETAEMLERSARTVRRDWKLARAWLARELESDDA